MAPKMMACKEHHGSHCQRLAGVPNRQRGGTESFEGAVAAIEARPRWLAGEYVEITASAADDRNKVRNAVVAERAHRQQKSARPAG